MTKREQIIRAIKAGRCGVCGGIAWDDYVPVECPRGGFSKHGCFFRQATAEEKAEAVILALGEEMREK